LSAVTTPRSPQSAEWARLRPTRDIPDGYRTSVGAAPALTVILPCYNEAERLPGTLQALLTHLSDAPGEVEVLVVDDGSTDATATVAQDMAAADRRLRVLSYGPNRGKGFAVRTGMLAAEGERVVITDADGSYRPSDLDRIVVALDQAPVAIGTRAGSASGPVARRAASRFDVEVLWLAQQLSLEVTEVRVQAIERQDSRVQLVADALEMLGQVWAVRQGVTNPAYGGVRPCSTPSPEPAAAAPAALQTS
jgi:cellulose synthase/poly-beta-1,6-N-acetylglucosamine synthase-like glycosyltransferase